jgi:tRNA nucleotidyltransferase/poly(A) polymerase
LRGIRFATRFEFDVEEEMVRAAASEEVRTALKKKVSPERIGQEVHGRRKEEDKEMSEVEEEHTGETEKGN